MASLYLEHILTSFCSIELYYSSFCAWRMINGCPSLLSVHEPVAAGEWKKLGVVAKFACLLLSIDLIFFFQMLFILDDDFVLLHKLSFVRTQEISPTRQHGTIKLQNTFFHGGRFCHFQQQFHHVGSFSRSLKDKKRNYPAVYRLGLGLTLLLRGLSVTDNSFHVWAYTCGSQWGEAVSQAGSRDSL